MSAVAALIVSAAASRAEDAAPWTVNRPIVSVNKELYRNQRVGRMGSLLLLGRWDAAKQAYQWEPGGPIELSNFSVLENRETHDIELYLAGYGQNPDGADSLKYTLTALKPGRVASARKVSPWFIFNAEQDNLAQLRPNADLLRSISVCGHPTADFVTQCHGMGLRVHQLVTGVDANDGAEFATPEKRRRLVAHYLKLCRDKGLDGVDLDFEGIDPTHRDAYSALLREASQALHAAGKELSMCVSYVVCTSHNNTAPVADPETQIDRGWYDPAVIGQTCDLVRVMCYDMTSPSSTAVGPVSTAPWARDAMRFWSTHVPKDKLVMGLPTYSRDFVMNGKRETLSRYAPSPELPPEHPKQRLWLPYEAIHQYRYTDTSGTEHLFLASDAASTRAHLRTAEKLGLDNIGFWHYGAVPPETWQAVREWAQGARADSNCPAGNAH